MKKSLIAAALLGAVLTPAAALAQDIPDAVASALAVGAMVYAPDGSEVGTIKSMPGGNVVISTGKHDATLPASVFGRNEKGLLISMTKAQLDAAVEAAEAKANAAMDAALVADAQIHSKDGVVIGTVQKVEGDDVTIDLPEGTAITLKKEHLTVGQNGLSLFMTAAEFKAAVGAATAPQATPEG